MTGSNDTGKLPHQHMSADLPMHACIDNFLQSSSCHEQLHISYARLALTMRAAACTALCWGASCSAVGLTHREALQECRLPDLPLGHWQHIMLSRLSGVLRQNLQEQDTAHT